MESVMERRNLLAGLMVLVISMFLLTGTAFAHKAHHTRKHSTAAADPAEPCLVTATPSSFMDQGEFATASSVADIIEVECNPVVAEAPVTISAEELYSRCDHELSWSAPPELPVTTGPTFETKLDNDGNATAVVWGGPSCAAGGSLITAELDVAPYTTVTTEFTVLPPEPTPEGLNVTPAEATESETTSSLATIVQVEFPPVYAEHYVNINDRELYNACQEGTKLSWVGPDEEIFSEGSPEAGVKKVRLDDDGNAFVVLLAGESCAATRTLVEASLEEAPYTTLKGYFTVGAPKVSWKE